MSVNDKVGYKVLRNDKVGRYAVASKNLKPGQQIFTEKPFAVGPKPDTPSLCLGCYCLVDGTYYCSKCSWPLCSAQCEAARDHQTECKVFSGAGVKFQPVDDWTEPCLQYDCITPLRVLVAKEENAARWENEIRFMESHDAIRKNKPLWAVNQINVVNFLRGPCKLTARFDEELIHTVCGLLEVNSFEVRSTAGYAIRGLYPQLAILSHNCVSNTAHSIEGDDYKVVVRAVNNLSENQELFTSYTYSLAPTLVRREFLKESKFFDCCCARCADPTELGTHMSTLKCTKCDNGWILSSNPLDPEAPWNCTVCEFTSRGQTIRKVFATIQAEIDLVEDNPQGIESREQLWRKYRTVLHPRNAYLTSLRQSLSQLYGRVEGYVLEELPDLLLERKIEICKQLLQVLDVIEPGHTRIRGMALYELHAPSLFLARSQYAAGTMTEAELKTKLEESLAILEQSASILGLEPTTTAEGIIGHIAQQSLIQLRDNLDTFIENA